MTNVSRWYGVRYNSVLFSGNDSKISDFRNACHRFVERDGAINHTYYFPHKKGNGIEFGSCSN